MPLPTSLFCGLTFEELAIAADWTVDSISSVLIPASDSIGSRPESVPHQFTINEL